jgi:alkaline phosphatase D
VAGAVATSAATCLGGIASPYLSRAADRPVITHGLQSGDVSVDSGVVWARADRPARMLVETATTESFSDILGEAFLDVLPETDFTGKLLLEGCRKDRIFSIASGSRTCRSRTLSASR